MHETIELLKRLARERFYGSVTVKFEAGTVTVVKKEETIKPASSAAGDYRDNRGPRDEQHS